MPRGLGTQFAAVKLGIACALSLLVVATSEAFACPTEPDVAKALSADGARSLGQVPGWYEVPVDHPAPAGIPLPPALMLGGAGASEGPVIDASQAGTVFAAMWSLRNEAFRMGSDTSAGRGLLAKFESGPALESDEISCGCYGRTVRSGIGAESLLVPRRTSYPATFLGEATTALTGSAYVQYLIISRQSVSQPWKVVSDPGYLGGGALDQPGAPTEGFDMAAAPGLASRTLPAQLAAYWQSWTITGHAPVSSDLAPGQWTTQAGATMAKTPDGVIRQFNGLAGYYLYHGGGPEEVWQFGTAEGGLTCGVVRMQTYWDYPGGLLYQPEARDNWGPTIAPGDYKAIVATGVAQPCFVQVPGSRAEVVSGDLGDDAMLGLGWQPLAPAATTSTT